MSAPRALPSRLALQLAVALAVLAAALPSTALAAARQCPPPPEPVVATADQTGLDRLDGWFGSNVVGPIAAVFFWDVALWDNDHTVSVGEQAACVEVLGEDPAGGFQVERTYQRRLAKLFPDAPPPPFEVGGTLDFGGHSYEVEAFNGNLITLTRTTTQAALPPHPENVAFPAIVAWLVMGAVFFTLRMQFINLRGFAHAVKVTSGAYDHKDQPGEITHFQALSSALSATVGLGNIAGVAIAITLGGPGAVFWLWVAAFLGMSSKFTEVTLGQMYRKIRPDGTVSGGPMYYLRDGLAERGQGTIGKVLAVIFAVMCIGGSLGGGNMFQANQSFAAVSNVVPVLADYPLVYGVLLASMVALVILGGIKRIGLAAAVIVPFMCVMYVLAAIVVLVVNAGQVPAAFASIVGEAFTPEAGYGGLIGVLVVGFQRASFSNEAGVGSASIAHSAASTDQPVREGIVALLEPFIDTIVVCTMTALVVVVTNVYQESASDGVVLTSEAFATVMPWFPVVLSLAVLLFAFSTMISWSYYGDRAVQFLFGDRAVVPYRILFVGCVVLGSVLQLGSVLDFSDLMVLGMAFPNIAGALLLSGKVKGALDTYLAELRAGKFDRGTGDDHQHRTVG